MTDKTDPVALLFQMQRDIQEDIARDAASLDSRKCISSSISLTTKVKTTKGSPDPGYTSTEYFLILECLTLEILG